MSSATVTKLAVKDGEFTDTVELEDHDTQLKAADMMLRMHGAYAPKDPADAEQVGVKVIIVDVPRPSLELADIGPGEFKRMQQQKQNNGSNGHKPQVAARWAT